MSAAGLSQRAVRGAADNPAAAPAPALIEVRGLTKSFGFKGRSLLTVDDVSFAIGRGEFVSLLGPSGSGKSTILNMIAGLLEPSGGSIRIEGDPVVFGHPHPAVGYVSQKDTCFPWRTVGRNIEYGLELRGIPPEERRRRAETAIRQSGLAGFENAYPLQLSGGMRQRVSLMRTLITRPGILLMDEAFGALDTHTKLEIDRILLLSARPGRLKEVFSVRLPRPRDPVKVPETQEYSQAFSRIWHSLGEEFQKGWSE